jgi:hypothetical protein
MIVFHVVFFTPNVANAGTSKQNTYSVRHIHFFVLLYQMLATSLNMPSSGHNNNNNNNNNNVIIVIIIIIIINYN